MDNIFFDGSDWEFRVAKLDYGNTDGTVVSYDNRKMIKYITHLL